MDEGKRSGLVVVCIMNGSEGGASEGTDKAPLVDVRIYDTEGNLKETSPYRSLGRGISTSSSAPHIAGLVTRRMQAPPPPLSQRPSLSLFRRFAIILMKAAMLIVTSRLWRIEPLGDVSICGGDEQHVPSWVCLVLL